MSDKKDTAIKLFGKTIKIGSNFDGDSFVVSAGSVEVDGQSTDSDHNILCSEQSKNTGFEQAIVGHETVTKQDEEPSSSSSLEVSKTRADPTTTIESPKALSDEKESLSKDESNKEEQLDQTSDSTQSQDQCHPKKPDKIIPCPRCNSMETKFCYFNNYNVNQPRHFCKNCQRYWTAGGTMRNVPVGAGRRKSKSSSSSSQHQHHDIIIPDTRSLIQPAALSSNGTLLTFGGQGSSLVSQSMASMVKLVDKSAPNCDPNGTIEQETRVCSPCGCSKNGKQDSNRTTSNDKSTCCNVGESTNDANGVNSQSLPPPLVCFTTNSWPYTWNPIPIHSGYPMPFYSPTPPPPPFLPCNPLGTWNYQWIPTPSINPENQSRLSNLNPDSFSLGKHSRDGYEVKTREENKSESSRVVMPKTLRIDDPIEAANSSIWGTLGINKNNNDKLGLLNNVIGGRFFGGFEQAKDGNNNQEQDNQISSEGSSRSYLALQANPAAFSRSLSFHENAY